MLVGRRGCANSSCFALLNPHLKPYGKRRQSPCRPPQRREGVAVKSLDDKHAVAVLLPRIIGDMPVDQITQKDAHYSGRQR